ncbi:hypothetical protein ACFWQL_22205 [Amycolatopsis thermoflava]|uniref:hypothetical protein n=1 Tax=Amycolatopsis thermoflava TaxID=84480 RepID=UPI00366449CA
MRCCSRSGGRFRYGFGLLRTAEATGGLLGAGIASRLGRRLGSGTALSGTAAVEGLAILGLASASNPYVAGLALAVCAAGMSAMMVLLYAAAPAEGPDHPASADRAPGLVCRSRAAWV